MSILWPAIKDPDDVKDYILDWTDLLNGDSIATQTWEIVDPPDASLQIDDATIHTSTISTVWVSGGTDGKTYSLLCKIDTNSSPHPRHYELTGRIKCKTR